MSDYDNIVDQQSKGLMLINIREMVNCSINKASMHLVNRKKTYNRVLVACNNYSNLGKLAACLLDCSLVIMYENIYEVNVYSVENNKFVCRKFKDLDFYYTLLDCMNDFQSLNELITKPSWNDILNININLKKHSEKEVGIFMGIESDDKKLKKRLTYKLMNRTELRRILDNFSSTIGIILKDMEDDVRDIIFWDGSSTMAVQTQSGRIMAFNINTDAYSKFRKALYKEIAEGFTYEQ